MHQVRENVQVKIRFYSKGLSLMEQNSLRRFLLIMMMDFDQCSGASEAKIFTDETWLRTKVAYVGS
jgi:hypothetical protein